MKQKRYTKEDLPEIRKTLTRSFKSDRGEKGNEIRSIEHAPILNEDAFLEAYNFIKFEDKTIIDELFGNDKTSNNRRRFISILIRMALYNNEVDDYIEQVFAVINHPHQSENLDYLSTMYGKDKAMAKLKSKGDRVAGENNPGFGHGGKLSPFSRTYIGYEGMSEKEIDAEIEKVKEESRKTKEANPQNDSTKIEYYLAQGLNEEEAKKALSERQTTFSLEKCIERHGAIQGRKVWEERQAKWLASLDKLSPAEKFRIARDKATSVEGRIKTDTPQVYLMKAAGGYMKFGVTGDIDQRLIDVGRYLSTPTVVRLTDLMPKEKAFELEDTLANFFAIHTCQMRGEDAGNGWASTETIVCENITEEEVIKMFDIITSSVK